MPTLNIGGIRPDGSDYWKHEAKLLSAIREVADAIDRLADMVGQAVDDATDETTSPMQKPTARPYGPPDELGRVPMGPNEYRGACAELERYMNEAGIEWRRTSGIRDAQANAEAGGTVQSKHRVDPCMATDYSVAFGGLSSPISLGARAVDFGLWATYHDTGSGPHLHTQGLPVGPIHPQWLEDWATEETKVWAAEVYSWISEMGTSDDTERWSEKLGQTRGAPNDYDPTARPYGPPDELGRVPMTPYRYAEVLGFFEDKLQSLGIATRVTSMMRSDVRNAEAGGTPQSKHRCDPRMAVDYILSSRGAELDEPTIYMAVQEARVRGLWAKYHGTGSGPHLHTQGLPVGPIHPQWLEDFASEETKVWAAAVYS